MIKFILMTLVVMSTLVSGCATQKEREIATSVTSNSGFTKVGTSLKKAIIIPENVTPNISYKEISGVWIGMTTGNISDFHLKNVNVYGDVFTADFFLKSTGSLSCSIDEKIKGTFLSGVIEFELRDVGCVKSWYYKATIDTSEWKGSYIAGPRYSEGVYVIKDVIKGE